MDKELENLIDRKFEELKKYIDKKLLTKGTKIAEVYQ